MGTVTNRIAQSACPGQSVRVIVTGSDIDKIPTLTEGQLVTVDSSSKTGYIAEIDTLGGNSFLVTPQYPTTSFNSTSNPEGLAVAETITY